MRFFMTIKRSNAFLKRYNNTTLTTTDKIKSLKSNKNICWIDSYTTLQISIVMRDTISESSNTLEKNIIFVCHVLSMHVGFYKHLKTIFSCIMRIKDTYKLFSWNTISLAVCWSIELTAIFT